MHIYSEKNVVIINHACKNKIIFKLNTYFLLNRYTFVIKYIKFIELLLIIWFYNIFLYSSICNIDKPQFIYNFPSSRINLNIRSKIVGFMSNRRFYLSFLA